MKCLGFMPRFILKNMYSLINTVVKTDKGFNEVHLTFMVVKDVAQAMKNNIPIYLHTSLYEAVMEVVGFSEEVLMADLGYLID
jgi:hypothetical protein